MSSFAETSKSSIPLLKPHSAQSSSASSSASSMLLLLLSLLSFQAAFWPEDPKRDDCGLLVVERVRDLEVLGPVYAVVLLHCKPDERFGGRSR